MKKLKNVLLLLMLFSFISHGAEKDFRERILDKQHDTLVKFLESTTARLKEQDWRNFFRFAAQYSLQVYILFQLWDIKDLLKKRY